MDRLQLVGLEELADRAMTAWRDDRPQPCALTPAERATMEGAGLCEEFKRANQQARSRANERAQLGSVAEAESLGARSSPSG